MTSKSAWLGGLVLLAAIAAGPAHAAAPRNPGFPAIDSVPRPAQPTFAETSVERPRLAMVTTGRATEFGKALAAALDKTHRFEVVNPAPSALSSSFSKLVPGISIVTCKALRKSANVDRVVAYRLTQTRGHVDIHAHVVWLDSGEVSRDLALFADSTSAKTMGQLAVQLSSYVRSTMPLRCKVKALLEDRVVLDLGANNGMLKDSIYQVIRYEHNVVPVTIGTVRVTATAPFSASAEVEDAAKDLSIAPGDVAIEQTGGMGL